jgi:type IV secretory pathway VirB10-like protein
MPFSMSTCFAGIGTIMCVLALGFGSGIVLNNKAIKDTPAVPTRIERVARREPIAAPPQVVEAKAITLLAADTAPAVRPVSAIEPQPVVAEVPKESHYVKEVEQAKQAELTKQAEQKEAEQRRATERRIDRQKRHAERKVREVATSRMKQRQLEEQGGPARRDLAYDRVGEPHFNLFESRNAPLRDRPADAAPVYRRD